MAVPLDAATYLAERKVLLHELRWEATRLREKPVLWSLLLVLGANVLVFTAMAMDAAGGRLELARLVTFASAAARNTAGSVLT